MFSFHQYMQTVHSAPGAPGGNWSRSDCLSFSPASRSSLPVLSLIGPAKTSNRPNGSGEHLGEEVLDGLDVGRREVGDALLRGLAVHEPEQAHRLRVGVEVLVAGLVLLVLDLLADPGVLGTPDPVRRGQAGVVACRRRGGRT